MQFSRVAIVFNPVGGSADPKRIERLRVSLSQRGAKVTCFATEAEPASATKQSNKALAEGADLIIAVGGDGTIREVAQAIRQSASNAVMAAYQGGTSNYFAESFYPKLEPERFVEMIFDGMPQKLDLIEIDYEVVGSSERKQDICIVGLCTGPIAVAAAGAPRALKRIFGELVYVVRVLYSLIFERKGQEILFKTDQNEWRNSLVKTAVVFNLKKPSVIDMARSCNPCDGLMDLVLVKKGKLGHLFELAFQMLRNSPDRSSHYKRYRCQNLEITAREVFDINLDGEPLRSKSIKLKVLPQVLRIIIA